MAVQDEVELEVLRAVEREACVHVAGIAACYPGTAPGDVALTVERLAARGEITAADLTVRRGEVHDVRLGEAGERRLVASRPDGDPH